MFHIRVFLAYTLACVALAIAPALAADQPIPCSAPESNQFDFWVGEWELTWADSGRGRNSITKELGGCVIKESFSSSDATPLVGLSVSVFVPNTGKWHQTWVDNQGSYLDFSGGFEDGKMILSRTARPKGKPAFQQRMVWFEIQPNSIKWNWERSDDNGKTWSIVWAIDYTRANTKLGLEVK